MILDTKLLTEKLASSLGIDEKEAASAVRAITKQIALHLGRGEAVNIEGFASFTPAVIENCPVYESAIDKYVLYPKRKTILFSSSEVLKEKIKRGRINNE